MQHLHAQGGGARTIAEEMGKRKAGKGTIWCSMHPKPSVILPFSTWSHVMPRIETSLLVGKKPNPSGRQHFLPIANGKAGYRVA